MLKFFFLLSSVLVAEQTLSIIKPDAIEHRVEIESYFESAGLEIVARKNLQLSAEEAAIFYAVHENRPFYKDLVAFMSSGPIEVLVLEGKDVVARNRQIMGVTDPAKASPGTIRANFGTNVQKNAVHGSDSLENAQTEISFFFTPEEVHP